MIESALLNRLKAKQAEYALQALKAPSAKTEFEYGHRCGVVAGLEQACDLLLTLLKDERDGERDLSQR